MFRFSARKIVPVFGSLLFLVYLLYLWKYNEVPADTGDGLEHFRLAKVCWNEHTEFLNHWGKPLFTIFSSPFAQFGYHAYLLFNIAVVLLILFFSARIFKLLNVSPWYHFLLVLALSSNYEWMKSVLGGLTEPLFGLLLVVMLWSGIRKNWIVFALLAGLAPFARSEGMLVLVMAFVLLICYGQWRKIPFLLIPFLLFSIAGAVLLDDFLWYFNNNPYGHGSYGKGSPWHYLENIPYWLSPDMLCLVPVAVFGAMIIRNRKLYTSDRLLFSAFLGLFLLIVAAHSWFWYRGTMSSLGLLRLATLGMPAGVLVLLICCNAVTRELSAIPKLVALIAITCYSVHFNYTGGKPLKPNVFEKILIEAGKEAAALNGPVYYRHPLIGWSVGNRVNVLAIHLDDNVLNKLPDKSYIIRDPQTGPVEFGLTFDVIKKHPELKLISIIKADGEYSVYTNEPCEIRIYQIQR